MIREESTEDIQVYGNVRTSSEVNGSFAEMLTNRREKSTLLTLTQVFSIKQCVSVVVLDDVEVLYTFLNNLCENFLVPPGRLTMLSTSLLDPLTPKI